MLFSVIKDGVVAMAGGALKLLVFVVSVSVRTVAPLALVKLADVVPLVLVLAAATAAAAAALKSIKLVPLGVSRASAEPGVLS